MNILKVLFAHPRVPFVALAQTRAQSTCLCGDYYPTKLTIYLIFYNFFFIIFLVLGSQPAPHVEPFGGLIPKEIKPQLYAPS